MPTNLEAQCNVSCCAQKPAWKCKRCLMAHNRATTRTAFDQRSNHKRSTLASQQNLPAACSVQLAYSSAISAKKIAIIGSAQRSICKFVRIGTELHPPIKHWPHSPIRHHRPLRSPYPKPTWFWEQATVRHSTCTGKVRDVPLGASNFAVFCPVWDPLPGACGYKPAASGYGPQRLQRPDGTKTDQ